VKWISSFLVMIGTILVGALLGLFVVGVDAAIGVFEIVTGKKVNRTRQWYPESDPWD